MIRRLLRTSGSCASSSERNFSATKRPPLRSKNLWLANCCFAHISLGFPFLLRFCDEQSGHSLYPFHGYPGPLARSWRRPFPSCGVPYPQAPTLDREAIPATIAEFMHLGPHPRRLDGALGRRSRSSAAHEITWRAALLSVGRECACSLHSLALNALTITSADGKIR